MSANFSTGKEEITYAWVVKNTKTNEYLSFFNGDKPVFDKKFSHSEICSDWSEVCAILQKCNKPDELRPQKIQITNIESKTVEEINHDWKSYG